MSQREQYDTDLKDDEWQILERLIPEIKAGGHPGKHSRREIVNGILYVLRSGCQWRLMPHDLPKWKTVYHYFRTWRVDGRWRKIHDALRTQVRQSFQRNKQPSAAILDSQTTKTTEKGGLVATMQVKRYSAESGICW